MRIIVSTNSHKVCDKIRVKVRVVDLVEYGERAMKHFTDAEVSLK